MRTNSFRAGVDVVATKLGIILLLSFSSSFFFFHARTFLPEGNLLYSEIITGELTGMISGLLGARGGVL